VHALLRVRPLHFFRQSPWVQLLLHVHVIHNKGPSPGATGWIRASPLLNPRQSAASWTALAFRSEATSWLNKLAASVTCKTANQEPITQQSTLKQDTLG
jgi:hypothetical protein